MSKRERPRAGVETLHKEVVIAKSLEETFAFFSDAHNLDRLTPPWVGFQILTPAPIAMRVGTIIDYRIRIHGVPITWRTEIIAWEPPYRFIDLQVQGPYRWWHHEHRFEPCAGGTRVHDSVEYLAPCARLSHPLVVRKDIERIFAYRTEQLKGILGTTG